MDSLCTAAARALAAGDPLSALNLVALRDDAPALALRGVAMAQLGDLARAKELLRRASRAFGPREALARARCHVAHAEVALSARDLSGTDRILDVAAKTLETHGDAHNALYARLVAIKRLLVLGRIDRAEAALGTLPLGGAAPPLSALAELARADIAIRRIRARDAGEALERARLAADRAAIPALSREVEQARVRLLAPAARIIRSGVERALTLAEVEAVLSSSELVIDACRRSVSAGQAARSLARRPILFALLRALGESWPRGVTRETLIARAFGGQRVNESLRARLRVELGRLRKELRDVIDVIATPEGFTLVPRRAPAVAVLVPPIDGAGAGLLALLADGEPWSTSALALALGQSQRTVQRMLHELEGASKVHALGRARARRWVAPAPSGYATSLLLPVALPSG
jgi:hypothetical protein